MYEYLKKLFAEGEALTWEQLEAKIAAEKNLKLANIADGGYVSKEKLDAKITELNGVKAQLDSANQEIQSYKDMDIDGVKKKADEWEQKYAADTASLQQKLDAQAVEFAAKTYLGKFKFANDLVRDAVYAKFMGKGFKREGDNFLGADEFMSEMQKTYPTGFLADAPAGSDSNNNTGGNVAAQNQQSPGQATQQKRPWFAPQVPPAGQTQRRTLSELMKFKNEHPDAKINFD